MATNLQLITDALRLINVISEVETPSPEQGSHGLRRLNQMLEAWTEDGIELGYFAQSSTADDLPIPAWAERGVTAMLAVDLAPTYGASLSMELISIADSSYSTIVRKCISEKTLPLNMDNMPQGEGKYRTGTRILTDN